MKSAEAVPTAATRPVWSNSHSLFLQRKCACGGSAGITGECSDCQSERLVGKQLQTKFRINKPGDEFEQEADRAADHVMGMPGATLNTKASLSNKTPLARRRVSGNSAAGIGTVPSIVQDVLSSPGQPMDAASRAFFEPRFGHDFSEVRVHSDAAAGQSARNVNAHAYTVGQHIIYGAGQFAPGKLEGRRLIAHELAHVLQQSGGDAGLLQRSPDDPKKPEEKPTAKFVGCDKDRLPVVQDAIKKAEALASRAIYAFERDYPLTKEIAATEAHFGSLDRDQKATIIERYKHVVSKMGGKTYTCATENKKVAEAGTVLDTCGEASCPGNNITVFPVFGKEICPAGPVMLHEAIHNAGACDDIKKGSRNYPPAKSENNAYSYESFAVALVSEEKAPELKKRKPSPPKPKI